MSYRYDKEKKKKKWYVVGIIILIISFFTPASAFLFDLVEKPFVEVSQTNSHTSKKIRTYFEAFFLRVKIVEENTELRKKVELLEINNLRTRYLEDQLSSLSLQEKTESDVIASIISHDGLGYSDTLLINRGYSDSVRVDDIVVSETGVMIGYVSETYDISSRVVLYSKDGQDISGILYPHNLVLDAIGYGNGSLFIKAQREIDAQVGDIFYSVQQPGRIIAIVRDIVFDPRDPFKRVYLSYPTNIRSIRNVIVTNSSLENIELKIEDVVTEDDQEVNLEI
jgi:cell shape-determining protein MreC